MFQKIAELIPKVFLLTHKSDEHSRKISALQEDVRRLENLCQKLLFEIEMLRRDQRAYEENTSLRLENILLRNQRGLPPESSE